MFANFVEKMSERSGLNLEALAVVSLVIIILVFLFKKCCSEEPYPRQHEYQPMINPVNKFLGEGTFVVPQAELQPIIAHNSATCYDAVILLRTEMEKFGFYFLGFDCEWIPNNSKNRNKVALLQLSTLNGISVLFRLCKIGVPVELKELLEDSMILKLGVGSCIDALYLFEDFNVGMNGVVDLRYLAKAAEEKTDSLGKMSERYMGVTLDKHVAMSNWERDPLSLNQVRYAAMDSLVGICIFIELVKKLFPSQGEYIVSHTGKCNGNTSCHGLPTKVMLKCDGFCHVRRKCANLNIINRNF